jgi:penicillin amidase
VRLVRRIVVGFAAVLLLGVAAIAFVLWRSVPPLDGAEALPGLGAAVEVVWDSLAIPHIVATSDRDAFTALGYLHARDRLWQMEMLRRAAEGRLSEIVGPAAVATDRFLRTLDIGRAARRSLAIVSPQSRALLDAYLAGVNRWIARPTRPLPPEFQVLRFRPEPWTAAQLVEVERLMAWDLVNADVELSLARAAARVGPDRVRDLFPVYPESGAVILPPGSGTWKGSVVRGRRGAVGAVGRQPAAVGWLPSYRLTEAAVPAIPPLAAGILDAVAMARASNSWVIGPARSRSGKPILANDPHLAFRAPSLWYLAAMESPGFHVAGATIPGLPAVVLGHNRRIAWGLTNIEADDVDYVIERLSPDSARVLTPSGWVPVEVVRDSIRVRGRPAVAFALRRTPHGPVLDDARGVAGARGEGWVEAVAMRWNGHDPSDELTAILGVDRAGSWAEFLAAVAGFRSPEQNWIYADVDGNIGYTASGAIPVRHAGIGLLPTPGWTDEGRWERYLDFEELPRAFDPPEGFIVTANNRIVGSEYPHLLANNPALPYRAQRIREMILGGGPFTADDVRRMQMDTLDVFARWAKDLAAQAAVAVGRRDVAEALVRWDGTMGADRSEPSVFYVWYRALQRMTYEDELGGYAPSVPLHAWLRAGASPWFDDQRTPGREDLAALAARAMREALPRADSVAWGRIHTTISAHALGSVGVLNGLLRLSLGPFPRAGSLFTVNVADFGALAPPFRNTHGASFRQVADLADVEGARMIITTGQSGNPVSRHYRDQRPLWWSGELRTVPLDRNKLAGVALLKLTPER